MYTQNTGLLQELAIAEQILLFDSEDDSRNQILVPDNKAEIFIPLGGNVDFQCLGCVRSLSIRSGNGYFLMPRGRGANISLNERTKLLIIKINPIYAKKIASNFAEIANGVFQINISSVQLNSLMDLSVSRDKYEASSIIEELSNLSYDLYDHNLTILESMEYIKDSCGTISIKEIYSSLNISKSKLEQHFNKEVGLTPKEYCKIEKINCFIKSYLNDMDQSLTELTYRCGYYDQSHLIKDFKYFLDTSPKKFFCSYR
ncbi:helix-turn-helix domain-containing protein [Ekhidna sp.]|uniref:helix-turn-helix domain-containing protein n=1 Tax=Ekhidna sp. TaxID=2608089 RepID=UPI003BAC0B1E